MCAAAPQTRIKPKRPSQLFCFSSSFCLFPAPLLLYSSFHTNVRCVKLCATCLPLKKKKIHTVGHSALTRFSLGASFCSISRSFRHLPPHSTSPPIHHVPSLHLPIALKTCLSGAYLPPIGHDDLATQTPGRRVVGFT